MTIADIIRNGRGTARAWHVECDGDGTAHLIHYGTTMLVWNVEDPHDLDVLDWSTGWGSVSDQNGMNAGFRELGLPYLFERDARGGGARITELVRGPEGHHVHPDALRPRRPRPSTIGGAAVALAQVRVEPAPVAAPELTNLSGCHPAELAALPIVWLTQLAGIRNLSEVLDGSVCAVPRPIQPETHGGLADS
jgi:hypothetical protein